MKRPTVLFAAAEVAPFAKVGGLADVAGALPPALQKLGADIRVIMPKYGIISERTHGLTKSADALTVPWKGGAVKASLWEGIVPHTEVRVYFVEEAQRLSSGGVYIEADASAGGSEAEFSRFGFFSAAVAEIMQRAPFHPDIVHLNDWHVGLVPSFLKRNARAQKILFTIHNLAYQGVYPAPMVRAALGDVFENVHPKAVGDTRVNSLVNAIFESDWINTVSPSYRDEILTAEFGAGIDWALRERRDNFIGIVNGINGEEWDPRADAQLAVSYDERELSKRAANKEDLQKRIGLPSRPDVFLIGMVSRLTEQKGFDILIPALPRVLADAEAQIVILATGSPEYAAQLRELQKIFGDRLAFINAFDEPAAHKVYGGADAFLMPSRFEPCGLGQMIAMRYGALPIVRATGGLKDTVLHRETGFAFQDYTREAFMQSIRDAKEAFRMHKDEWRAMQQRAMAQDFSWDASARKYMEVYEQLLR